MSESLLRRAVPADSETLTAIAHAAKAHWGYPQEWFELWRDDLAVTPQFIAEHLTLCAEVAGKIVGFAAVAEGKHGWELKHMWVLPTYMGRGVGRDLLGAIQDRLAILGVTIMRIASDPHAVGFYEQLGAQVVGEVESVPAGRRLPLLVLSVASRGE